MSALDAMHIELSQKRDLVAELEEQIAVLRADAATGKFGAAAAAPEVQVRRGRCFKSKDALTRFGYTGAHQRAANAAGAGRARARGGTG